MFRPPLARGVPDVIAVLSGRCIGIEAKSETGRQSPDQAAFQAALDKAGGKYILVRSAGELSAKILT